MNKSEPSPCRSRKAIPAGLIALAVMIGIIAGDEAKAQAPSAVFTPITDAVEPPRAGAEGIPGTFTIQLINLTTPAQTMNAEARTFFFNSRTQIFNLAGDVNDIDGYSPEAGITPADWSNDFTLEYVPGDRVHFSPTEGFDYEAGGGGLYRGESIFRTVSETYTFRVIPNHDTTDNEGVEHVLFGYRVFFSGQGNDQVQIRGSVNTADMSVSIADPPNATLTRDDSFILEGGENSAFNLALGNAPDGVATVTHTLEVTGGDSPLPNDIAPLFSSDIITGSPVADGTANIFTMTVAGGNAHGLITISPRVGGDTDLTREIVTLTIVSIEFANGITLESGDIRGDDVNNGALTITLFDAAGPRLTRFAGSAIVEADSAVPLTIGSNGFSLTIQGLPENHGDGTFSLTIPQGDPDDPSIPIPIVGLDYEYQIYFGLSTTTLAMPLTPDNPTLDITVPEGEFIDGGIEVGFHFRAIEDNYAEDEQTIAVIGDEVVFSDINLTLTPSSSTVTIRMFDNDEVSAELNKGDRAPVEGVNTPSTFTVTIAQAPDADAEVTYTLEGGVGTKYNAIADGTNNAGILSANGTFTIPRNNITGMNTGPQGGAQGAAEVVINITPQNDADSNNEDVTLTINSITFDNGSDHGNLAAGDITNGAQMLTIRDDTPPLAVELGRIGASLVPENAGTGITFTLRVSNAPADSATVTYTLQITGDNAAADDVEFQSAAFLDPDPVINNTSNTFTIQSLGPDLTVTGRINIHTREDDDKTNEVITLTIFSIELADGRMIIPTDSEFQCAGCDTPGVLSTTIRDNDGPNVSSGIGSSIPEANPMTGAPVILEIRDVPDNHGDGMISVTIPQRDADNPSLPTAGLDYIFRLQVGTLPEMFPLSPSTPALLIEIPAAQISGGTAGEVDIEFHFTAVDDNYDEEEIITINLGDVVFPNASPSRLVLQPSTAIATVRIEDDDTVGVVTNSGSSPMEGDRADGADAVPSTFTLVFTETPDATATVSYDLGGGLGTKYTANLVGAGSGETLVASGGTFTVPKDNITGGGDGIQGGAPGNALVTINIIPLPDDDPTNEIISLRGLSVTFDDGSDHSNTSPASSSLFILDDDEIPVTPPQSFTSQITFAGAIPGTGASRTIAENNTVAVSTAPNNGGIDVITQTFANLPAGTNSLTCVFHLDGTAAFGDDYVLINGRDNTVITNTSPGYASSTRIYSQLNCGSSLVGITLTSRLRITDDNNDEPNETVIITLQSVEALNTANNSLGTATITAPAVLTLTINDDDEPVTEPPPPVTDDGPTLTIPVGDGTDYFSVKGSGKLTAVATGVTCSGCATLRAYEDTDADGTTDQGSCTTDMPSDLTGCNMLEVDLLEPGDGEIHADKVILGSFAREVLWVAEDAARTTRTAAVQRLYIQPVVGFDVSAARVEGSADPSIQIELPVSVAVSDDVTESFETEVRITRNSGSSFDDYTINSRNSRIAVPIAPPTAMPNEVTLSLRGASTPPGTTTPPGVRALYTLGSSTITVTVLPAPTPENPEFEFTPQPPLFVDDSISTLGFSIASTPEATHYVVTAQILNRSPTVSLNVTPTMVTAGATSTVSFGSNIQAGDIIKVTATADQGFEGSFFLSVVAADAGVDDNSNGIPDTMEDPDLGDLQLPVMGSSPLEVSGVGNLSVALGSYAVAASVALDAYSAAIPSGTTASAATGGIETPDGYMGTGVFDFIVNGVTPGGVVSVLIPLQNSVPQTGLRLFKYDDDDGGWNPFTSVPPDAYYGAPLPCPAINAPRGTGEGEWRAADDTGLQAGDGCLLMEITDGGWNDADGTRNGVIYDPNALGGVEPPPSGGGVMDPIWLLLAALALTLSYASRRKQRHLR